MVIGSLFSTSIESNVLPMDIYRIYISFNHSIITYEVLLQVLQQQQLLQQQQQLLLYCYYTNPPNIITIITSLTINIYTIIIYLT